MFFFHTYMNIATISIKLKYLFYHCPDEERTNTDDYWLLLDCYCDRLVSGDEEYSQTRIKTHTR